MVLSLLCRLKTLSQKRTGKLFFVFMISLFSAVGAAKDGGGNGDDFYKDTPENHRAFTDSLTAWAAPSDFEGYSEEALKELFRKNSELLKKYRFEEVALKIKQSLLDEVAFIDSLASAGDFEGQNLRLWFFSQAFDVLERIGNRADLSEVETIIGELVDKINYLRKQSALGPELLAEVAKFSAQAERLIQIITQTSQRRASAYNSSRTLQLYMGKDFLKGSTNTLLLTQGKLSNYEGAAAKGMDWIDDVRSRMEAAAFGQPEAIEAFLELEYQRLMKPTRTKPQVLWMMGIESTGKDTHAEAYVDAIHGYKGAHREHMFELRPARSSADAWKNFGSNTGYVGSDKQTALIRFLVEHSGGKYKIEVVQGHGKGEEKVVATGKTSTQNAADAAVIFINELHNWSKEAIDVILKEPLEKGTFKINSPNGGLDMIEVPVTFVIASNDGVDLIKPKGHSEGRKLTYDELLKIWESNHKDYDRIRQEISKKNTIRHGEVRDMSAGISEEVLARIPNDGLVLMRPLSPEVLQQIAKNRLDNLFQDLGEANSLLGRTKFTYSENLPVKIQQFLYNPEQGGRSIDSKVRQVVSFNINRAIKKGIINKSEEPRTFHVDIVENDDLTWSLKIDVLSPDGEQKIAEPIYIPVEASSVLKRKEPLSDEAILRLKEFEASLSERIVGAQHLSKQLKEALLAAENARHAGRSEKARRFLFLGLSSTGKTQTAKEVATFLYGDEGDLVTIDFNGIVSEHQVREMIYGTPGGQPSPFMRAFDRKNGKVIFLFDEIANVANPNILTPLYQLLDEKRIDGFNDGRIRSMEGVSIIMTGNAGEEIFYDIPRSVPEHVQRAAMDNIYRRFMNSPSTKRVFLEKKFRQAFLNRIGDDNTFFFAPLDYRGVRELIHIKLKAVLKSLASGNGRNYHIVFKDEANYNKILDVMELEGFRLWEQGRSIDRYVSEHFSARIMSLLQDNLVPSETKVILEYSERLKEGLGESEKEFETFKVWIPGKSDPLKLRLETKKQETEVLTRYQDQIQTAFHEAGHEIARQALMQDLTKTNQISIMPGVTELNGRYVYYAGIAKFNIEFSGSLTREYVLSKLAQLIAGGEAQRLISKGHKSDGGQSNDLERANTLAKYMILKLGLDKQWGLAAPSSGQSIEEYLATLSELQRKKLDSIARSYMAKAKKIAHEVLAINYKAFIEMGVELAKKGNVNAEEIYDVYKKHPVPAYWEMSWLDRKAKLFNLPFLITWAQGLLPHFGRNLETVRSIPQIAKEEVANIDNIIEQERQESLKKARVGGPLPVAEPGEIESRCKNLMGKVAA